MPGGQVFGTNSRGGFLHVSHLSKKLRKVGQPRAIMRQFTETKEDFGKSMGDTLLYDKVLNIESPGGKLVEGVPVPKAGIIFTQGQCVAYEWGHAIGWTSKWETMSEFDVKNPIFDALIDDNVKTMDREVASKFRSARVKYIPTGTTGAPTATWVYSSTTNADGEYTTTTSATRDFAVIDLKNIKDALEKGVFGSTTASPVAPWDGKDHLFVGGVDANRAIFDDPEFDDWARYGDPERLWNGEVGRLYGTRCVKDNHVLGLLGTTSYKGEAFMFGKETVMEIVVEPDHIRNATPGDFNRDRGMGWFFTGGFATIWPGPSSIATEPMVTIVHVTSA